MTHIELFSKHPATATDDALVIATVAGDAAAIADLGFDSDTTEALNDALEILGASGKVDDVHRIPAPAGIAAKFVVFTGLGSLGADETPSTETLRRTAGAAARSLAGVNTAVFALPAESSEQIGAIAEGAAFGAHPVRSGITSQKQATSKNPVGTIKVATSVKPKDAKAALTRAVVIATAVTGARDLINTPPNILYPESFAAKAKDLVKGTKVKIKILDEAELRSGGYGGITGVGQGSARGPRLVKLSYTPSKPTAHYALVGKGITFDTGGISIKPAAGMELMKNDMSGAAAVLHAVLAAAELGVGVQVTGYLALAENMPSANAQRPSDVITIRGGTTVEVLNTDAEGRLVMADAIVAAVEDDADVIIDIATLTGAQLVALGTRVSAVMGTDDVRGQVIAAAGIAGELMWPMPLPEELRATMDSTVADIANIGERWGGMLSGGVFLQEFTDGRPWAHLDIAGPAFNMGSPRHYEPKGGTGAGVRTLLAVLEAAAHA